MRPVRSLSEASVKSSGFGRLSNCTGCCLWHALTSSAARVWLIVDALRRLGSPSPAVSRYLHAPPPPRPPNRMSVRYATTARDRIQIFRAAKRGRIPPSNLAAFLCYATSAECRGERIEMRSRKIIWLTGTHWRLPRLQFSGVALLSSSGASSKGLITLPSPSALVVSANTMASYTSCHSCSFVLLTYLLTYCAAPVNHNNHRDHVMYRVS